jgi:hypothetical protein
MLSSDNISASVNCKFWRISAEKSAVLAVAGVPAVSAVPPVSPVPVVPVPEVPAVSSLLFFAVFFLANSFFFLAGFGSVVGRISSVL